MEIRVAYILIVVLAGLAIAAAIFASGMGSRTEFQEQVANMTKQGLVRVLSVQSVGAVGMKDCQQGETIFDYACVYRPNIAALLVDSEKRIDRLAVAVSYGGISAIIPCRPSGPWGAGVPSGPCKIDQQVEGRWQAALDLKPELLGKYLDSPPPINASERLVFNESIASGLLANGQRLILGNHSFEVSVRDVLFGILKDFEIKVSCGNEMKIVNLDAGERAHLVMCGADVGIEAEWKWKALYGKFRITVGPASGGAAGEPVFVSFWLYDDAFRFASCGTTSEPPLAYYEPIPFDAREALMKPECAERFLGGQELRAPVDSFVKPIIVIEIEVPVGAP